MNIIFLNPDQMRADVLGCYGHPLAQTPNIDRLAAEGTRFDQCHVQHTVCTPSRCSFMTGWYPHVRGHRSLWHMLQPDEPNLMRYMKRGGYQVHWRGKNDLLTPGSYADSVDSYGIEPGEGDFGPPAFEFGEPGFYSFLREPTPVSPEATKDFAQYRWVIDFLKSEPSRPFFLNLTTGLPHPPYGCPQPWYDRIDPDDLPDLRPADLENKPRFYRAIRETRALDQMTPAQLRKIMAVYLGMVEYVDWMVGRVLDALDETGLAENTAVVLFSDHGDWTGDYGLVEKWPAGLDDCLTRVPLIIRAPGFARGHVVFEPVEVFDVMATTLSLAGLQAEHDHFSRDLTPQLRGEAGDPDRAVFAEGGYEPFESQCFEGNPEDGLLDSPKNPYYPKAKLQQDEPACSSRAVMIRTGEHKLVRRSADVCELYDLRQDPNELANVYGEAEYAHVQLALESRLLSWHLTTSDVTPKARDQRGHPG